MMKRFTCKLNVTLAGTTNLEDERTLQGTRLVSTNPDEQLK